MQQKTHVTSAAFALLSRSPSASNLLFDISNTVTQSVPCSPGSAARSHLHQIVTHDNRERCFFLPSLHVAPHKMKIKFMRCSPFILNSLPTTPALFRLPESQISTMQQEGGREREREGGWKHVLSGPRADEEDERMTA